MYVESVRRAIASWCVKAIKSFSVRPKRMLADEEVLVRSCLLGISSKPARRKHLLEEDDLHVSLLIDDAHDGT